MYDVIIVGGGPAGLSAALALGRARKRVLLCDAGTPRNAEAEQMHNFVTRDGTPPAEFRRIGREQLALYPNVEVRAARVERIDGEYDRFEAQVADERVSARRVLLATGLIDDLPPLPGLREHWGKQVFQCPYCHAWENQDRPFGYLMPSAVPHAIDFSLMLLGWTDQVTVFTGGQLALPVEAHQRLVEAGIRVVEQAVERLVSGDDGRLAAVQLADGTREVCEALFMRPPQRQIALVSALGLELDEQGFVRVNEQRQTSRPGIYAAGDLATMMQGAVLAASAGTVAAAMLNHELTVGSHAAR